MSKLAELRTAAAAKLANVPTEVRMYLSGLESKASANRYWIAAASAAGFLAGLYVRGFFKH